MLDLKLKEYATERQWEYMVAIEEYGSHEKAAAALKCNRSSVTRARAAVKKKAASRGYSPDHDMRGGAPDGFVVTRRSHLTDADGETKLQWTRIEPEKERQYEAMKQAVEALVEPIEPQSPIPVELVAFQDNLLAAYPVGDHHHGMFAQADIAGGDFDIKEGERLLCAAMDYLVKSVPSCEKSLIAVLGDFLHYDGVKGVTPKSGNVLDVCGHFHDMVRVAIRSLRYMINSALQHHKSVHVIIETGNHDLATSVFLRECIAQIYENEPRITVDTSPQNVHYYQFGQNLVGVSHGDNTKMKDLPLLMATDKPQEWAESKHRVWWTGHIHHQQLQDFVGCTCESFRILPPADNYAHGKGYRSQQGMKAIVFHKDHGEVARYNVTPDILNC